MRKLLISLLFLILCLSSCKKNTINNTVNNYEIDVEDKINIDNLDETIEIVSKKVLSYGVGIECINRYSLVGTSKGSGVLVGKGQNKYLILTNKHVVTKRDNSKFEEVYVYINEELKLTGSIKKIDNDLDLALVEIETELNLSVCKIADEVKIGRFCIAVGCPYDMVKYFNTITVGNISNLNRVFKEKSTDGKEVDNIYIQHTAAINNGSSGGGLFNLKGELVGINTMKLNESGNVIESMNFAVGVNDIINFLK